MIGNRLIQLGSLVSIRLYEHGCQGLQHQERFVQIIGQLLNSVLAARQCRSRACFILFPPIATVTTP
jgi:hypothetical protein